MNDVRRKMHSLWDVLREVAIVVKLWLLSFKVGDSKEEIPLVVSMTSFPARIDRCWISVETILQQTIRPSLFLLVLAEEEFPNRKIPRILARQVARGLTIQWEKKNGKSYDKLLPALAAYPHLPVVTVDDDKYFPEDLLATLWNAHLENPAAIVGARGWQIRRSESGAIRFGDGWQRIRRPTHGKTLHLPGGNGTLYPPGSLAKEVSSLDRALEICPTTDDIWFWAHGLKNGSPTFCLGLAAHRPVKVLRSTPALSDVNSATEQDQFRAVIAHLDLQRKIEAEID